tara:strand:- start:124 stop:468 length:345 start_codon:yes stop_codon:yes gene_type:complete
MTTEESNKLIAEFMGYKLARCNNGLAWDIGKSLPSHKHLFPIQGVLHTGNELHFHTSWDWLMPVVSKITRDEILIENEYSIMDTVPYGLIEDTYKVVVEFIKWYNQQKDLPDTM